MRWLIAFALLAGCSGRALDDGITENSCPSQCPTQSPTMGDECCAPEGFVCSYQTQTCTCLSRDPPRHWICAGAEAPDLAPCDERCPPTQPTTGSACCRGGENLPPCQYQMSMSVGMSCECISSGWLCEGPGPGG